MKEKHRNKDQERYQTIPELAVYKTRESQLYKKAVETSDKNTRRWGTVETPDKSTRGWLRTGPRGVVAETPEFCGRQIREWLATDSRKWLNKIGSILNLIQDLPLPNQLKEKTLFITTRKREMLKQVQHGHCMITTNTLTSFITTSKRETLKSIYWTPYNNTTGRRQVVGAAVHGGHNFITVKAFTLIEFLVVVLIIGILAAIAVPQYQKAVLKSRYMRLGVLIRSLKEQQELYYMNNGKYATSWNDLQEVLPSNVTINTNNTRYFSFNNTGNWYLGSNDITVYMATGKSGLELKQRYNNLTTYAGQRWCVAYSGYPDAIALCRSIGGKKIQDNNQNTTVIYSW